MASVAHILGGTHDAGFFAFDLPSMTLFKLLVVSQRGSFVALLDEK